MIRIVLPLLLLSALAACQSEPTKKVPEGQLSASVINDPRSATGLDVQAAGEAAKMHFADTSHNFGWMNEGEVVTHDFSFTNTGKSPLIIAGASTTCGCTVPDYTKEPIAPGKSGNLKVTFSSAGKWGHILKSIVVSSNAFPATQVITIIADIKSKN